MSWAYLAPEIPSVSATFVYRELLALERETGAEVAAFSLRDVEDCALAADGRSLLERTQVVYDRPVRLLWAALGQLVRHPVRCARAISWAAHDLSRGRCQARWKLVPKLIGGLYLASLLQRRGCRHLHVHFAHAPATVGMYAARAAGIEFSVTAHANDIYVHQELLAEKVQRARAFVTISEVNRHHLARTLQVDPARIHVVHCGVDLSRFLPTPRPSERREVLCVARLVPKKGIDLLLRAMASLPEDVTCVLAGEGPERPGLERLVVELGLERRVRFEGAVRTERIRQLQASASVFALPCREATRGDVDGIPVVLMEAMAAGLPVVTTDVGGVRELVQDERSGSLVAHESPMEIAGALQRLLSNPDLAKDHASAARDMVEAEFDLDRNTKRLLSVVQAETPAPGATQVETSPAHARGPGAPRSVHTLGTHRAPARS